MVIKLSERTSFGHPQIPAINYHNIVTNNQWSLPGVTISFIWRNHTQTCQR